MIDQETAYKIATDYINTYHKIYDDTLVILDNRIIEKDFGWIFCYQTKRGLETNMTRYKMIGNCPIIVDRLDGSIHYLEVENGIDAGISFYQENRGKIFDNYAELDGFLECYMAKTGIGDFLSDDAAIQYYITYAKSRKVQEVIQQGKCLLTKEPFPWERISELTERCFDNPEKARQWLVEIISLLECAKFLNVQ
ncbi:MAG: hypothetical protein JGK17_14735 [Microcoleus sp. PH2017_10_PVI_O_A]|uniref:YrhB domain-containing protein n=1 Tax=unclassified Microcoleus TaxID=2642155 RepID=UPI001DBF6250|nr:MULTISPECIES: YrhB domain-containing protein [unclassified Microcoleus]TAE82292.1 MAG: hypothetical protein EAZ83_12675 [Oscillatoriales cyanobacterium]MCC3406816.1 hypothetical protein [Microcoleus sp. PH2017_10_PVI_O_A]MCC3460951.1 hypothetical protein [Microcoleus sp. PH2017_11_PCY_U_A]MCC3479473.1 hypothetical protein [Microcoleus sp. PH2017_12_PCY_D_A]MCC3526813.1 hypothetical protein [Microcoleus sp. PH2017_21_RUC_O_A]